MLVFRLCARNGNKNQEASAHYSPGMNDFVLLDQELEYPAEMRGLELFLLLAGGHILVEQEYPAGGDGRARRHLPLLDPRGLVLLRKNDLDVRHLVVDSQRCDCTFIERPASAASEWKSSSSRRRRRRRYRQMIVYCCALPRTRGVCIFYSRCYNLSLIYLYIYATAAGAVFARETEINTHTRSARCCCHCNGR